MRVAQQPPFFADLGEDLPRIVVLVPETNEERGLLLKQLGELGVCDSHAVNLPEFNLVGRLRVPSSATWDEQGRLRCEIEKGDHARVPIWFWFVTWESLDDPKRRLLWWNLERDRQAGERVGIWDEGRLVCPVDESRARAEGQ